MTEIRAVWLLVGSAGATGAIGDFFCAMRSVLPVAFVYAQHFDPQRQNQLQDLSLRNPAYELLLPQGRHRMKPGEVLMVPPKHTVRFESDGLACLEAPWRGHYAPNFDQLLANFTTAPLPSRGLIVFSGMGDDGTRAMPGLAAAGATLWAQSPASAVCGAMPRAALNTGVVDGDATPQQLALMLQQLY